MRSLVLTSDRIQFQPKEQHGQPYSLEVINAASAILIPTRGGAYIDFFTPCGEMSNCSVLLDKLPSGSFAVVRPGWVQSPTDLNDRPQEYRRFDSANRQISVVQEFVKASDMRLYLVGAEFSETARTLWNKAAVRAEMETTFDIRKDRIVNARLAAKSPAAIPEARLAWYSRQAGTSEPALFGRINNIKEGTITVDEPSEFVLENGNHPVSFSILPTNDLDTAQKLTLALPALHAGSSSEITREQKGIGYITYHKPIRITWPAGFSATANLSECLYYEDIALTEDDCRLRQPVTARIEYSDNGLVIYPEEAQVTGLWLVELNFTQGIFVEPEADLKEEITRDHEQKFGVGFFRRIWRITWFVIKVIFWLIIAFLLLAVILDWQAKLKLQSIKRKRAAAQERRVVTRMQLHDPQFNVEDFKERGRQIARAIQDAWCAGDMRPCRRYLSQGVYNRFRLQLKIMRELEKRQNVMADFRILHFGIVAGRRSGSFDTLVVRMQARARDTTVPLEMPLKDANALARRAPLTEFCEYYTFMRSTQAQTTNKLQLNACARCGTPFAGEGEVNKCSNCGTTAGSGEFDWVLAEITQASEYRSSISLRFPDLSPDRIEDRASFLFWRNLMATMTENWHYLSRDATDECLANLRPIARLNQIAVGASELEKYEAIGENEECAVRIYWSASSHEQADPRARQSLLRLKRPLKWQTADRSLADHSCEACGAPLPETDSTHCSYCRSPLLSKNRDWLLDSIETDIP